MTAVSDSRGILPRGGGRREAGIAELEAAETMARTSFVSPYHLAYVHTGLGETDRAMDLLERAAADGAGPIYAIGTSFLLAPLREHPRFRALLEATARGDSSRCCTASEETC